MPNDRVFFLVAVDRSVRDPDLRIIEGLADRLFHDDYAVADVTDLLEPGQVIRVADVDLAGGFGRGYARHKDELVARLNLHESGT